MPLKVLAEKMTAPGQMIAGAEETRRGCQKRSIELFHAVVRRWINNAKQATGSNASITPAAILFRVLQNEVDGIAGFKSPGSRGELSLLTAESVSGGGIGGSDIVVRKNSGTYEPVGRVICTACSNSLS